MLKLELTVDEVNFILGTLAKLPFEQVYPLVGKIQQQVAPQVNAQNKPADTPAE